MNKHTVRRLTKKDPPRQILDGRHGWLKIINHTEA